MDFKIERKTGTINVDMLEDVCFFYKITCNKNGKSYIGRTNNPTRRIEEHLTACGSNLLLYDLVEYSWREFTFCIVGLVSPATDLDEIEDSYINKYDSLTPNGYNMRLNCDIVPNLSSPIDLNNIEITAKYNFPSRHELYFSVGKLSNARSYRTLCNLIHYLHSIDVEETPVESKSKKFDYYQFGAIYDGSTILTQGVIYSIKMCYSLLNNEFVIREIEAL